MYISKAFYNNIQKTIKQISFKQWIGPLNKTLLETHPLSEANPSKYWKKKKKYLKQELCKITQKQPNNNAKKVNLYRYNKVCGNIQCTKKYNNFKICKGCQSIYYCTRKCQKKDWMNHKIHCNKLKKINEFNDEFIEFFT